MPGSWPTQKEDMRLAEELLIRHFHDDGEGEFGVEEVTVVQEGSLNVERATWVIELEEAFQDKYGESKGLKITNSVISELIITGKKRH